MIYHSKMLTIENVNLEWRGFVWSVDLGKTYMCHNSRKAMRHSNFHGYHISTISATAIKLKKTKGVMVWMI